jgi:hypothetical protein
MSKSPFAPAFGVLAALLCGNAMAGQNELVSFFDALEGRWDGDGVRQVLQADGKMQPVPYEVEFDHDDTGRDEWRLDAEFKTKTGTTSFANVYFRINGDALYISTVSPIDPAEILENTPRKLTWRSYRTDWVLRRTYVTVTTFELTPGNQLKYDERVTLNGVTLQTETATLRK